MAIGQPSTTPPVFGAASIRPWTHHRVKIKPVWGSDWSYVDYIHCSMFRECAAPSIPSAQFVYHAGYLKREDESALKKWPLLRLNNWFICVELINADRPAGPDSPGNAETAEVVHRWTGVILSTSNAMGAGQPPADAAGSITGIAPMRQDFSAFGLEALLDLKPIWGSVVPGEDPAGQIIERIIPFNARLARGLDEVGNRSYGKYIYNEEGAIVFSADPDAPGAFHVFAGLHDSEVWTIKDAVQYIIRALAPDEPAFELTGQFDDLGEMVLPKFDLSGMSVKQALDALINPSRGFGWCVRYPASPPAEEESPQDAETDGSPQIHIFSVSDVPITFADQTLPANNEIVDIILANRIDVAELTITQDERVNYGQIYVSGEQLLVCGTFSTKDGTLEKGWTDAQQTAYVSAVGSTGAEKDQHRRADELAAVFSLFRVPDEFPFMTGDGQGASPKNANPAIDLDGSLDTESQAPVRLGWGLNFERNVPFFKPRYTEDMKPDYRDAIGMLRNRDSGGTATGKWIYTDAIPAGITPLDNDLGIILQADPAHLMAKGRADSIDTASGNKPLFDYDDLIVTLAFRTDQKLSVVVDVDLAAYPGESEETFNARKRAAQQRVLAIEVPGAELWYVVPGTIEKIDGSGNLIPHNGGQGGVIRNDAEKLRRVAASARAWFGKRRQAMSVTFRNIQLGPIVGMYVSAVNETARDIAINSIVTEKIFNLDQGTTTITTGYNELDFAQRSASSNLTARQQHLRR